MRSKWMAAAAALVLSSAGAAGVTASTDTTTSPTEPASSAPVPTTPSETRPSLTVPEVLPERILSLSPTATEMLFAIGAGDQVVAVDSLSTYPPEAAGVLTDLSAYEPNVEAIAEYEPDLVITTGQPDLAAQLDELGIAVWASTAPSTFDGAYAQIRELGAITGHLDEADDVATSMEESLAALAESAPELDEAPTVFHELSADGYTVTSDTFIGQVYALFGLENIADRVEGDHGGYPQLNAEMIVEADPDLIFLADTICCGETPESVAARPGWDTITAVAEQHVYAMNDDLASRWGPRVVDYAETVLMALEQLEAGEPNVATTTPSTPAPESVPDTVTAGTGA